jgi:Na+-transporting NADH:ubiquinone oxidoreductase subunit NqrF
MGDVERNRLAMEQNLAEGIRLSCQIHVAGDLKLNVINQSSVKGMDAGPRPVE